VYAWGKSKTAIASREMPVGLRLQHEGGFHIFTDDNVINDACFALTLDST
jgi:hypothetical protein